MKYFQNKSFAIIFIAVSVLFTVAAAIFYSKPGSAGAAPGTEPKAALTVTTVRPVPTRLPIRLSANGSIAAWQEALVGSEANGLRLTDVRVNVGDRVRAGQVLATFALDSVQADVAQSRANVAEAEANALEAATNAAKARTLQASGALSEQQINQYSTLEKTAQARLESALALRTVQQVRLRQTRLLAPDDGIISARSATVGAVVSSGTELFKLIRGGRLEWRAEVTSSELARLSAETTATVTAANGVELKGRVRMIAPTVDPLTRSALVYVDLPNTFGPTPTSPPPKPNEALKLGAQVRAGMFAKGEFDLGSSDGLTVPQQAVVIRDGFSYVFVVQADRHVRQVKVQAGRRLGVRVEVLAGVTPDLELVASGAGFLNDGDLVNKVASSLPGTDKSEPNKPLSKLPSTPPAIK